MIEIRHGVIKDVLFARPGITAYTVIVKDQEQKCLVYHDLVGDTAVGDEVLLNTTAVSLGLGTGGYHYVLVNLSSPERNLVSSGHIMKMRYSPLQIKVLSVEEQDSPYHQILKEADSLEKTPVLVGSLHSMLAPLCLYLNHRQLKVAYVMTDGAALPLVFSQTVDWLKKHHLLAGTVTVGHAFGGDLEAVNVYSGLLAAYQVYKPDVIIVSMGPGIVGTGTKWGFTGLEQGEILNAVDVLRGIPIAIPRISFADPRKRHQGISHHTLTVLERVCKIRAIVPLPLLELDKNKHIQQQLRELDLLKSHDFCMENGADILPLVQNCELKITTMGRGPESDPEFFTTLGAAACAVHKLITGQILEYIKN